MIALVFVAAALVVPGFHSPSGNIRCYALPNVLHCDITRADYQARLQDNCLNPKGEMGAGVDWHGFEVPRTGKGHPICAGGALLTGSQHPRYALLPYGRTWRSGVFTCISQIAGVTCRNRAGHGVFVSRQSYRLF
jgi:hypothetical protein